MYRGRLAALERDYRAGRRPLPGEIVAGTSGASPASAPKSVFGERWIVIDDAGGLCPDLRGTAVASRRLREALMSRYGAAGLPIPEFVSGHKPDGSPTTAPHLAIVPMADVGHTHSEGRLMGLGVVLLRSMEDRWRNAACISVPFTVSQSVNPAPVISGIGNAASYASGYVSPGEIVVIFGTGLGPSRLSGLELNGSGLVSAQNAGTVVQFNGFAAPIVYTSSTAVAAVAPYEIAGSPTVQVTVTYQGEMSAPLTLNTAASVPGIFTANSSGIGQAVALNYESGQTNSATQPAPQGSIVILYATGEGQSSPAGVDGKPAAVPLPKPLLQVSATIGGVPATVLYAGGAYGDVAGVLQVNVMVPTGVSGSAVPLVFQVGSAVSQTGITISVAP